MNFVEQAVNFSCDDAQLYGVLSMPEQPARRGVLIVVGGPQYRSGSHRQFTLLARSLAAQGIAALRFDYRGMGDSEGDMRDFEQVGDDLRAATDYLLQAVPGLDDVVLWGLCDAASAAMFYASQDARVGGLVLLNPWARTSDGVARTTLKHYYGRRLFDAALWKKIATGRFEYRAAMVSVLRLARAASGIGRPAASPAAVAPLPDRMLAGMRAFKGRVLLIISPLDLTAQEFLDMEKGSDQWQRLLAEPRVTRQTLAEADHTFSRRIWRDQVAAWTGSWVKSW